MDAPARTRPINSWTHSPETRSNHRNESAAPAQIAPLTAPDWTVAAMDIVRMKICAYSPRRMKFPIGMRSMMSDEIGRSRTGCQCLLYNLYMSMASDETGLAEEAFFSRSRGYAAAEVMVTSTVLSGSGR